MATGRIFRALTGAALLTFFTLGTGVYDEPTLHRGSGDRHAEFVRHTGTILVVTPVIVTEVDDAISCSFACLSYAGCFSYNVRATPDPKGRFACDLLATDKYNASGDFRPSSISDHYSIKSPCEVAPCQNGGSCVPAYSTGQYRCTCPPPTFGAHCQEHRKLNSCRALKQAHPSLPDGLYALNSTRDPGNDFQAYCDMTSFGGGWTMCYTTDEYADPKDETTYDEKLPYRTDGYRTNCNDIEFTEIIFIDEVNNQKEYFTRQAGGDLKPSTSYGDSAQPQGLWDSHGLADSSYSYQLLICDHAFYSGFHVSGYTRNCYKQCGSWCGDQSSPYFRTSATHNGYSGVAFNVNGHSPNVVPKKLVSVGLR